MRAPATYSKQIIFITGTDTGVGKTVLTTLLLHHLRQTASSPLSGPETLSAEAAFSAKKISRDGSDLSLSPGERAGVRVSVNQIGSVAQSTLKVRGVPSLNPIHKALAIKPFCSGSRADVRLLQSFQPGELTDDEANSFYFRDPVAPLVALRKSRRKIALKEVLRRIENVKNKCDCLLIEGSGGLLVPLAETFSVADLIAQLNAQNTSFRVIVVARNRLGTINHTILTVRHLQITGIQNVTIALMSQQKRDFSAASNQKILAELLHPIRVELVPFLGPNASRPGALKNNYKKVKKTLAQLLALDKV
jgi:dethiobiotin synthetase